MLWQYSNSTHLIDKVCVNYVITHLNRIPLFIWYILQGLPLRMDVKMTHLLWWVLMMCSNYINHSKLNNLLTQIGIAYTNLWSLEEEYNLHFWPPITFASQLWFWNLEEQSVWFANANWMKQFLARTWKVMFRAVKYAASTEMVALLDVDPVTLAVSLCVIIVMSIPAPWSVMWGFVAGIVSFSLQLHTIN